MLFIVWCFIVVTNLVGDCLCLLWVASFDYFDGWLRCIYALLLGFVDTADCFCLIGCFYLCVFFVFEFLLVVVFVLGLLLVVNLVYLIYYVVIIVACGLSFSCLWACYRLCFALCIWILDRGDLFAFFCVEYISY